MIVGLNNGNHKHITTWYKPLCNYNTYTSTNNTVAPRNIFEIFAHFHDSSLIVTGPAKIDHVSANYTELYFR